MEEFVGGGVERAAEMFVDRLGAGRAVWQNDVRELPSMPITGIDDRHVPLSGGNALVLVQAMWDRGWRDPRFLTSEQVASAGASVSAGAEGMDVQFVRAVGADGSLLEQPEVVVYKLFNAAQVEGLGAWVPPLRDWSLEVLAKRLLPKFDVNIVHDQVDKAFFSADDGNVHMPPMAAFASVDEYVGVAVHELSHATRGELDREVVGEVGQPSFAREELRAELASMQLSIALGVPHDVARHARFAGEWATVLRDDPGELFRAARDAEKMAALVLWHVKAVEREMAVEQEVMGVSVPQAVADRVVYSVSAARNYEQQEFSDPRAAAKAFHEVDANDQPVVIKAVFGPGHAPGGSGRIIARTSGVGAAGQGMLYGKYTGGQDSEFDAAYAEFDGEQGRASEAAPAQSEKVAAKATTVKSAAEKRQDYQRQVYADRAEELFQNRQAILAVPLNEKDVAKKLGAVFYGPQKVWFVPAGVDLGRFRKWSAIDGQGDAGRMPSRTEIIAEFEKAMRSLGLSTELRGSDGGTIDDGKWHYVRVTTHKKTNAAGAVILNVAGGRDGRPCGFIENKLSGDRLGWVMDCPELTPEQLARMRAEALAREEAAAKEIAQKQEQMAEIAADIWASANVGEHGYFTLKGVQGHAARVLDGKTLLQSPAFKSEGGGTIIRARERYALIPLMDETSKIWALQAISEDGKTKAFMSGARKKGLFCVIGEEGIGVSALPTAGKLGFVEGFATGASFFEKNGFRVAVCFDAGNMEAVAKDMGKRLAPEVEKVIGADNDQFFMERAFGALARIGVVAHGPGAVVKVMSGPGETREVPLGQVVADGEWHQAAGGRYRVTLEDDKWMPGCVGKVCVELFRNGAADGQKETLRAGNRGVEAGYVAAEAMPGAVVVIPKFDSLSGRPTDWNDLAKRGGDVRQQVEEQLGERPQVEKEGKEATVGEKDGRGR